MFGFAGHRCVGVLSKERQPPGSKEELCDCRVSSADVGRERRHRCELEGTLRQISEKTMTLSKAEGIGQWVAALARSEQQREELSKRRRS